MMKIGACVFMLAMVTGFGLTAQPGEGQRGGPAPENSDWDAATRPAGFIAKTLNFEGRAFNYVVYAPRQYHPQSRQRPWPTIVFMHGSGECGDDGLKQLTLGMGPAITWNRERWPFLVIMPQKPEPQSQWENYDAALMAMIDATKKEYPVDPERMYLTGMSQGGHGTWALAALHPEMWAALAPVCGYINGHGSSLDAATVAERIKHIPVWAFHGEADNVVPAKETSGMIDALRKAGAKVEPRATIYPGVGHNSWDKAYSDPELAKWLLDQSRHPR